MQIHEDEFGEVELKRDCNEDGRDGAEDDDELEN
jgi:hypothetical protein